MIVMKLDQLRERLIQAARSIPADDRVPFAFEKRVIARLKDRGIPDRWALWASGLWRAAAPCLAICCLFLGWSLFLSDTGAADDFTQDLEYTVLVAADPAQPADSGW